jgi:hypothetical protein
VVFTAVGVCVVPVLPGVPRMNAIAGRWAGSCRRWGVGWLWCGGVFGVVGVLWVGVVGFGFVFGLVG